MSIKKAREVSAPAGSKHVQRLTDMILDARDWTPAELFHLFLMDIMGDIHTLSKACPQMLASGIPIMPVADMARKDRAWNERELEALRPLGEVYAKAVQENPPFWEILGNVYQELSNRGRQQTMGQYFTPYPVADAMSLMLMGDMPEDRVCNVLEPTSGSGVLLLSFARQVLYMHGPDRVGLLAFTAVDADPVCALMTAIQLYSNAWIHRLPLGLIRVYRGNSLGPWTELDLVLDAYHPCCYGESVPAALDEGVVRSVVEHLPAAGMPPAAESVPEEPKVTVERIGQVDLFAGLEAPAPDVALTTQRVKVSKRCTIDKSTGKTGLQTELFN